MMKSWTRFLTLAVIGFALLGLSRSADAQVNNGLTPGFQHPSYQEATAAPYYAADAANYDARLSALENALKKKQDKPDPKKGFTRVIDGRIYFTSYNTDPSGSATGLAFLTNNQYYTGISDLRIGVKGEGYDILDYKVDLNFADQVTGNNVVGIRDVWLGVKNVPLLEYVKIGNYRIEDGISNLTGGTNTTFFEFEGRDFAAGRRLGISSQHLWANDRVRFFAGVFDARSVQTAYRNVERNHGSITNLRFTFLPYASRGKDGKINGKKFALVGFNYAYVDANRKIDGTGWENSGFNERFATLANFNNIGDIVTNGYQKIGLEFAAQNGPFTLQSEWYANVFNEATALGGADRADRTVWGGYLEARCFLTGDYRKFSASSATWGAVDLRHNLDLQKVRGHNLVYWLGGWEVAAKWAYTDTTALLPNPAFLNQTPIAFTGEVQDFTLGLNWYWSPQARWMFDYSHVVPSQRRLNESRDHSDVDVFAASFRYNF